jgi:hypothetical protein
MQFSLPNLPELYISINGIGGMSGEPLREIASVYMGFDNLRINAR